MTVERRSAAAAAIESFMDLTKKEGRKEKKKEKKGKKWGKVAATYINFTRENSKSCLSFIIKDVTVINDQ
jgi:hypothetical protein